MLNYTDTVRELESRSIMPETAPSLEPMHQGLKKLLSPALFKPKNTIVVAGTNGKGSVCASLEALLRSAGMSVGLYTSPHLIQTTERIRINGKDISEEEFCCVYQNVSEKTNDLKLTHFEMLTLMAAWCFFADRSPVDWAIFEVGLGGLWDATNAIPHETSIITTLGYDHQNLLGNTLQEIAINKFGIISDQNTVIHSPLPPELSNLAAQVQLKTRSRWIPCTSYKTHTKSGTNPQFILETQWGSIPLALPGARAALNSSTALTAFSALGFSPENHLKALSPSGLIHWPGRMEKITLKNSPCPVYLSGDHNPDGVKSLLELLPYYSRKTLHILVGIGKDKDHNGILELLNQIPNSQLYLTETPFRGRKLEEYGSWVNQVRIAERDPQEALLRVLSYAHPEDLVLVTGSLYLVGHLRSISSTLIAPT